MIVRKYRVEDRPAVESIHFKTGFLGSSMDALLSDSALWDAKIAWYLDQEPQSSFVLDSGTDVLGYLVGCLDDERCTETEPINVLRSIVSDAFSSLRLPAQDRRFWMSRFSWLGSAIIGTSGERNLQTPSDAGHLHINLLPEARGQGYGTGLLNAFEQYAREQGVATLHAESFRTSLNPNTSFWERNGFEVYSEVSTTQWKAFVPGEIMSIVSYRKDLVGSSFSTPS
jgi:GNAT superfamily N-acetyltransferase